MNFARFLRRPSGDPAPAPPARIEPALRAPLKIAPELLGASRYRPAKLPTTPWTLPPPPPGMIPEGAPTMAQDDSIGSMYGWAGGYYGDAYGEGLAFAGYPYLAELTQRPEYRRGAEIIAKEMTREWLKLVAKSDDKGQTKKLGALDTELDRLRVRPAFKRAGEQDGFFGRSQIFLDTGASDEILKTPLILDPATIKVGALKRLVAVEPIWTYPARYNSTDPLAPDYYKPTAWYVMGKEIHASRFLTFVAREVPDLLKPAYMFGGLSLSQMAKPYVDNWLQTRGSVNELIQAFSTMVLATNMGAALTGTAGPGILDRVALFNNLRRNGGSMVIDKETELLTNVAVPLGTLDHLQAQAQEHMSSVYGIPLVVFFGISPSGLNASSEGEIAVWNSWIRSQQENLFSDNLLKLLKIVQLSLFGAIDDDIGFTWEPLAEIDEAKMAAVRKSDADVGVAYIGAGVLSPEEERMRLAGAEDSLYPGLDVTDVPEPPAEQPEPDQADGDEEKPA